MFCTLYVYPYLSEGKILFSGEGRDILSLSHLCKNDSVNAQRMNTRRKTIATNTAECLLLTTLVSQWTPSSSSGKRQNYNLMSKDKRE